jgi:hypothetical protein
MDFNVYPPLAKSASISFKTSSFMYSGVSTLDYHQWAIMPVCHALSVYRLLLAPISPLGLNERYVHSFIWFQTYHYEKF